jgi:predicted protein tyrosine phosphatase
MIRSTVNQLYNVLNPNQGEIKRVLTVCSAGLLRSATAQQLLIKEYGYNVRNCGTEESYALIPISEGLIRWADEIIFVENYNYKVSGIENYMTNEFTHILRGDTKIIVLDIPDVYDFNNFELINIIRDQYNQVQVLIVENQDSEKRVFYFHETMLL